MMLLCIRCVLMFVLYAKCMSSQYGMNSGKKVAHMPCFHFVDLFQQSSLKIQASMQFDVRNTKLNANFNILIY